VIQGSEMLRTLGTANMTVGQIIDRTHPSMLADPRLSVAVPTSATDIEVHLNLTDAGVGIKRVILSYHVAGGVWTNISAMLYNREYLAIIPKQGAGALVEYRIIAVDYLGNTFTSDLYSYTIASANYSLYVFLIALIIIGLISIVIIRRHKRAQLSTVRGPNRYKLIKHRF
jgi:hypothetical protein